MAVASTPTKLPLATFARILGMDPLHFEQVHLTTDPHCSNIMVQWSWQASDAVSREEVATIIADAESKVENALGYRLAPSWEVDEWRPIPQPAQPEYVRLRPALAQGRGVTIKGDWGYFIGGGIEAKALIEAAAAIVWTDEDNDGYFETGTVIVTTTVSDINEIGTYYPGRDAEDTWEIRPTNVTINLGTATIKFRRELAVKSDIFESVEVISVSGLDDTQFLDTVDIYRHYTDPSQQVTLLWEPFAFGGCGCQGGGCPRCAFSAGTGCLISHGDPRLSQILFTPANWNVDTLVFDATDWGLNRGPDMARLYYKSGWRDKRARYGNSRMAPEWERTITYMAAAMLDRPICDCMADQWNRWRQDLTIVDGSTDNNANPIFRQPTGALDNPFGTTRGEVNAWRQVRNKIIGGAATF